MAFLRLIIIGILLTSCHEEPNRVNRTDLIAGSDSFGKTWQVSHIDIEIGTVTPFRCVTDNYITYFPNGKYEINEGSSKCDPNDPPAVSGVWFMNETQEQLIVELGDSIQMWRIESMESDSHEITSLFKEGSRTYTFISSR
ncbi:hypothetical protein [Ekhidna sp.]